MPTAPADPHQAEADERRLHGIVSEVLAAPERDAPLRRELLALEAEGNSTLLSAVFELLLWRAEITDYWVFYVAALAYQSLDRQDAAFLTACTAARIGPEFSGNQAVHRILFEFFRARRRPRDADDVIARHVEVMLGYKIALTTDVALLSAGAGGGSDPNLADDARILDHVGEMTAEVLADPNPEDVLLRYLATLDIENQQPVACMLFESVCWRIKIRNYWTYFRLSQDDKILGRRDAAFLMAAMADQCGPTYSGAYAVGQEMFLFFQDSFRARDAVDVFLEHANRFPHKPVATLWQVAPLLAAAGLAVSDITGVRRGAADAAPRRNITIAQEEVSAPWTCHINGGGRPAWFAPLARGVTRPSIEIACIPNGELLIDADSFVVCDANGGPYVDLSIHDFPLLLKRHIDQLEATGQAVERIELDEAVVIGDRFAVPPNLCHFLLDHFTRLDLYRRAGVDIRTATVIGGEPTAEFQKVALAKCGVTRFLHTGRMARLRATRLWISSNCRDLRHPAHHGAGWAIDYLRRSLIPERNATRRRLYVSRNDASARRVINEAEVVARLQQHGFEVIVPGQLPFEQQIAIFADAAHVVGAHGAGLTNIVFSPAGTSVLELFHPLYGTASYASLALKVGLQYSALLGRDGTSDAPEFNDPLHVDPSRNMMGNRDIRVDLAGLVEWLEKCCLR